MIDTKTIKHIASLARLDLTEKEVEKMKDELSSVLGYVEKLNKADTNEIEPLYQTTGLVNSMRDDHYRKDLEMSKSLAEKLIGQAPKQENGFIKVKSVFSK